MESGVQDSQDAGEPAELVVQLLSGMAFAPQRVSH
jgi:hypothetical protein